MSDYILQMKNISKSFPGVKALDHVCLNVRPGTVHALMEMCIRDRVTTYGEIARQLARQSGLTAMSAQAVGGAVGHNPISIIIPCHRVVGTNGSLTGYAGGLEKKIQLLQREGVDVSRFSIPKKGTAL